MHVNSIIYQISRMRGKAKKCFIRGRQRRPLIKHLSIPRIIALCSIIGFTLLTTPISSKTPQQIVNILNKRFYYPQDYVKKSFKMRMKYTGADKFIRSKIDRAEGEKAGNYYVIFDKKKNKLTFDVSAIAPRLSRAVRAILSEHKDSILPPTIKNSLKGYNLKVVKDGKFLKLFAYIKKKKYRRPPPIIRIEYYLDRKYNIDHIQAFLHTNEKIISTWKLAKNKTGKFIIKRNHLRLLLRRGKVDQENIFEYKEVKGLTLPTKVTINSRYEGGKVKTEYIYFYDHEVH